MNKTKAISILLVLFSVFGGIYYMFFRVGLPDYLPMDDSWTLLEKKKKVLFGIYCKFEVVPKTDSFIESLKKRMELREWEPTSVKSSKELALDSDEDRLVSSFEGEDKQRIKREYIAQRVCHLAPDWVSDTKKPFTVYKWVRLEEGARKRYVSIRVIESNSSEIILELWDFNIHDD